MAFLPKENFPWKLRLSTTAGVPQHLNVKDKELIGRQTKNYSISINMQKSFNQSAQFIKSFVRHTWFKSHMLYKASLIVDYAYPIFINVTFIFPKLISACKKLAHFINSFLRYSRFKSHQTKKVTPISDPTTQKL